MTDEPLVYVARTKEQGVFKIGSTQNLSKRYQSGRSRSQIVMTIRCSDAACLESAIHELFDPFRLGKPGELFRLEADQMITLARISTSEDPIKFVSDQPAPKDNRSVCSKCGNRWHSRVPSPKSCPKCKRYQ